MITRLIVTILFILAYSCIGIALESIVLMPALFAFYGFCSAVIYMVLSRLKFAL